MSDPDYPAGMAPHYPLTGEGVEGPMVEDISAWEMCEEKVEVDQTPLQEQLQKNKECK